MQRKIASYLERISLTQQFMLVSLVILILSTLGLGWWVGKQIETGVINRIAAEKALYVNSFIHPSLENFTVGANLDAASIHTLDQLVQNSHIGENVVAFKIWDLDGRVIYSTSPGLAGRVFPITPELSRAMQGKVTSGISNLSSAENLPERSRWNQLLETYSPVTRSSTSEIIAVVEFYQTVDDLRAEIGRAQVSSWVVLIAAALVVYLILSIFVKRASDIIDRQQMRLNMQIAQLTELLAQNADLHERVKRASSRTTALNEHLLRRISAELHDGPAQDVGYALLRLDGVQAQESYQGILKEIETSLQHAMQEIRAISAGMGLPELDALSLEQTLERVVRSHERRTGTHVDFSYEGGDESGSLSTRMIVYRVVQEALNNSFRHGGGKEQRVWAVRSGQDLCIEISDQGPGFEVQQKFDPDAHLGLSGIRERVNSVGGQVQIESAPGQGTLIRAQIPLQTGENFHE